MTDKENVYQERVPSVEFIDRVKQVLEHLYDMPYLQRHILTEELASGLAESGSPVAQSLRRELVTAIEALNPGLNTPFRSSGARLYHLLHMHYVEGLTIQEAARDLGISVRQAYRDMRQGEESVALILWERYVRVQSPDPRVAQLSSIQTEVDRLDTQAQNTDLMFLLKRSQKAVERLAVTRSIQFNLDCAKSPVLIWADPVVGQQVLTSMLSYLVQHAQTGSVSIDTVTDEKQVSLSIRFYPNFPSDTVPEMPGLVPQLIDRLGWTLQQRHLPDGRYLLSLTFNSSGPSILVIDDNEGLVELLERYLTDQFCKVIATTSGAEGLRLAQTLFPDAIILDVMMPHMDGWEVLQSLRSHPQTATIPVIICSVFNDPELAYSLGVSLFLPKPISRNEIFTALRHLAIL
jgi:CheY-like chemotaxis protein